jgi:3-hydroxyisobutyrate dehydrogenase
VTGIGFIGAGTMGLPMCANLAAAGHEVIAADARPSREQAVTESGARWAATPAQAASRAGILITMLPGPAAVSDVMTGAGGALAALPSQATWIDMTSNSPAAGRELTTAAHARGIAVLDAPAGGGPAAARAGTLQLFVGGEAAVLDRCRPVLEVLADPDRIVHAGRNGAGYVTKLLVNLLWFGQSIATAEALLIGRQAGIDLDVLHHALAGSPASSAFIRNDLGALLSGDYLPAFGLDRCCEELSTVARLADDLALPSEMTRLVEQTYQRALHRYGPVKGELLAVALLEEQAGIRLRHQPHLPCARRWPGLPFTSLRGAGTGRPTGLRYPASRWLIAT